MFDLVVGCGQGGCRVAKSFAEEFEAPPVYFNLARGDFSKFDAPRNQIFLMDTGGTGRDPNFGEKHVRSEFPQVREFLQSKKFYKDAESVVVCVGGGGGAGTGFLFPIVDYLIKSKKNVLLVFTLPERKEGIPSIPNSLHTLDRIRREYVSEPSKRISVLPVDNQYCMERYGRDEKGGDYWKRVNLGIVRSLKRFWMMTNLEKYKNHVDFTSTNKALDVNDVRRILFGGGFLDVREVSFSSLDTTGGLGDFKKASLVFPKMETDNAQSYVVAVGVPAEWKESRYVLSFIDEAFGIVAKATKKLPDHTETSYFNKRLTKAKMHVLVSGVGMQRQLSRLIELARKNRETVDSREGVGEFDLSGI